MINFPIAPLIHRLLLSLFFIYSDDIYPFSNSHFLICCCCLLLALHLRFLEAFKIRTLPDAIKKTEKKFAKNKKNKHTQMHKEQKDQTRFRHTHRYFCVCMCLCSHSSLHALVRVVVAVVYFII